MRNISDVSTWEAKDAVAMMNMMTPVILAESTIISGISEIFISLYTNMEMTKAYNNGYTGGFRGCNDPGDDASHDYDGGKKGEYRIFRLL